MSEERFDDKVLKNLQHIEDDLRNGRYSVVLQESCKIFESIFKQLIKELFKKFDLQERLEVTQAMKKIDSKPYEKFTFGQLVRLFNEAKIFELWKKKENRELGLVSTINFFPIVEYRNMAAHDGEGSRAEAELIYIYMINFLAECGLLDLDSSKSLISETGSDKSYSEVILEYCDIFQEALVKILKEITDVENQKDTEKLIEILTATSELCKKFSRDTIEEFTVKEMVDLDKKCHFFKQWYDLKYKKGYENIINTLDFSHIAEKQDKILHGKDADFFEAELIRKYLINFLANLGFESLVRKIIGEDDNLADYISIQKSDVRSVKFKQTRITLKEGETAELEVQVYPEEAQNKKINLFLENECDSALIQIHGKNSIKALKKGYCVIMAVSEENSLIRDSCFINIESSQTAVEKVVTPDWIEIIEGEEKEIHVDVLPENASDKSIKWEISNQAIVQHLGGNRIKGLKAGQTLITAISMDNVLAHDKCFITITPIHQPAESESDEKVMINRAEEPLKAEEPEKEEELEKEEEPEKEEPVEEEPEKEEELVREEDPVKAEEPAEEIEEGFPEGSLLKDPSELFTIVDITEEKRKSGRGNTVGNILNGGVAALQGEWIFFGSSTGLFKERLDGTGFLQLMGDNAAYINVAGDWVYFTSAYDSIIKIKTDGSSRKVISDKGHSGYLLTVENDTIYYMNRHHDEHIYRMTTDGSSCKRMDKIGQVLTFCVYEGFLYYVRKSMFKYCLYRAKLDGSDSQKICSDDLGEYPRYCIDEGWIYYTINKTYSIYKVKVNGTERMLFSNTRVSRLNNAGNWLYFISDDTFGRIRLTADKADEKSGEKEILYKHDLGSDWSVVDRLVYYKLPNKKPNGIAKLDTSLLSVKASSSKKSSSRDAEKNTSSKKPSSDKVNKIKSDTTVVFSDEDGEEHDFTLLDMFKVNGIQYIVLLPSEDQTENYEVVIFEINGIGGNEKCLPVQDEKLLVDVFMKFKKRMKDDIEWGISHKYLE